MHRVWHTCEVENQLVARTENLGIGHTLLRASRPGIGPLQRLGAIELEIALVYFPLVCQKLPRRNFCPPGTVSLVAGAGVLS